MQRIQGVKGLGATLMSLVVMAIVALVAIFVTQLAGPSSQKVSAAGCTLNVYLVEWPAAGLYERYWPHVQRGTYGYPNQVSGPHGYHNYYYNSTLGSNVTAIGYNTTIMAPPYNTHIMRSGALKYLYCY